MRAPCDLAIICKVRSSIAAPTCAGRVRRLCAWPPSGTFIRNFPAGHSLTYLVAAYLKHNHGASSSAPVLDGCRWDEKRSEVQHAG
jgi:hypothetical protein